MGIFYIQLNNSIRTAYVAGDDIPRGYVLNLRTGTSQLCGSSWRSQLQEYMLSILMGDDDVCLYDLLSVDVFSV